MAIPKKPIPHSRDNGEQHRRRTAPNKGRVAPRKQRQPRREDVSNPYDLEEDDDLFSPVDNSYEDTGFEDDFHAENTYADDYDDSDYPNEHDDDFHDLEMDDDYDDVGFEDLEPESKPVRRRTAGKRPNRTEPPRRRRPVAPEPVDMDDTDYGDDDSDIFDEDAYFDNRMSGVSDPEEREELLDNKRKYDEKDIPQEIVKKAAKKRKEVSKIKKKRGLKKSGRKNRKDETGGDVFVDEKKLKLEPFAKNKAKPADFDKRKDKQKQAKYIRAGVLTLIVALVGLGVKNAIIPPYTMTPAEVQAISMETVGKTNFPEERGRSVAEDFIKAYLTVGGGDPASSALSFFYTGSLENANFNQDAIDSGTQPRQEGNAAYNGLFKQKFIIDPKTYESYSIDDNTAYFVVGALVKPDAELERDQYGKLPPTSGSEARWVFFNVNVYYDTEKDAMFITKDSPTLVPDKNVGATLDAPDSAPIGDGTEIEDKVMEEITPTALGYINGFAKASEADLSPIEQYLSSDAAPTAKGGLGGEFALSGNAENAVNIEGFNTGTSNEAKLKINVRWKSGITREGSTDEIASSVYNSTYVMTLKKSAAGRWEVTNFDSMKYVPEEEK